MMIPGEYRVMDAPIPLNEGRSIVTVIVINRGDRPIQVGSHYHFFEVNRALSFDRQAAFGRRLDIPAGTAVRFEPGEERPVPLVELGGSRTVYGLNGLTNGTAAVSDGDEAAERMRHVQRWMEGPDA